MRIECSAWRNSFAWAAPGRLVRRNTYGQPQDACALSARARPGQSRAPVRWRLPDRYTHRILQQPPPASSRSDAKAPLADCAQLLGEKYMHQPSGLTVPATILQCPLAEADFPGMNCMQPSHFCVP